MRLENLKRQQLNDLSEYLGREKIKANFKYTDAGLTSRQLHFSDQNEALSIYILDGMDRFFFKLDRDGESVMNGSFEPSGKVVNDFSKSKNIFRVIELASRVTPTEVSLIMEAYRNPRLKAQETAKALTADIELA